MRKYKIRFLFTMVAVVFLSLNGCAKKPAQITHNKYISLTLTYESLEDTFTSDIITIDISSNEAVKRTSIPYERDYPIGVFSIAKNTLYYSAITDNNSGNQIFSHNLDTGEKIQLTENIAYVSNINLINDKELLINSVRQGADDIAVHPSILNLVDGSEIFPFQDVNLDFRATQVRYNKNDIIFSSRNILEFRERLDMQEFDIEFLPSNAYIYSLDKSGVNQVAEIEDTEVISIDLDETTLTVLDDEWNTLCIEISSSNDCDNEYIFGKDHFFDPDSKMIYSIMGNKVVKYDVNSGELHDVYVPDYENYAINNMTYIEEKK